MKRFAPVIRIHRSGTLYIVFTIVLGVLAINGGNNIHYLATAILLGYMLASGIVGRRNIRKIDATLSLPDEIYAQTPFYLGIEVRNASRFAPAFLVDVRVGDAKYFFPLVPAGSGVSASAITSLGERGSHVFQEIEISSAFPFNFFTRFRRISAATRAVVFPEPIEQPGTRWTGEETADEAASISKLAAESDIVGVRPYEQGDPMRRIHWKSSARTGKLNSKLYDDETEGGDRMIDLDLLLASGRERGLSAASYEISKAIRTGEPIGMREGDATHPVSSARSDKLAMLERLGLHD